MIKSASKSYPKRPKDFESFKSAEKYNNSANTNPNHNLLTGNSTSRPEEGLFDMVPDPQNRKKYNKNCSLNPFGAGYPGQIFRLLRLGP